MDIELTNGKTVRVKDNDRLECQCGENRCPFLKPVDYDPPTPMERCRVVWCCILSGTEEEFPWDSLTSKFDARRTERCMSLDSDNGALLPEWRKRDRPGRFMSYCLPEGSERSTR